MGEPLERFAPGVARVDFARKPSGSACLGGENSKSVDENSSLLRNIGSMRRIVEAEYQSEVFGKVTGLDYVGEKALSRME